MNVNILELSPGDIIQVNGELHKIKSIECSPYSLIDEHGTFANGYIPSLITLHSEYIHPESPRADYIHDEDFIGSDKEYYKTHYYPSLFKKENQEKQGRLHKIYSTLSKIIFNR